MWPFSSNSWQVVRDQKCAARDAAIASTLKAIGVHEEGDVAFTSATASEIVKRIESGQWTARQVVEAFIRQAAIAQAETNCLTEILFDQAIEDAAALDKEFAATKQLRGPLHGVPVSVKDQYEVVGYDATIGFTQWANKPCTADADLVRQVRAAGGIIFAKTNVPQTMLSFESVNPLWGRTVNPWSKDHAAGGSTGGEGALLALSGTAIGLGSDIGGSLRIPTAYCGIYSLKPGHGRLSPFGTKSPQPGFEAVHTVVGPMARSVDDVELFCRTCFGAPGLEREEIAPVPYRDVTLPAKLRFGYYKTDGFVKTSPACQRAVTETVAAMQKAGHECVEIDVTAFVPDSLILFASLTSADGYKKLLSHLGPDPRESSLFLVTLGPRLPSFIRNFAAWAASTIIGDKIFGNLMRQSRTKSTFEFIDLISQKQQFRRKFYEQIWAKHALDGIIAPVQATPALPHGATTTLSPLAAATLLYNIVDSPAGVIPVTRVSPTADIITPEFFAQPGGGSSLLEADLYKGKTPFYDAVKMQGLPVGVQVVGKSWEDEKVVAMMRVVDNALGERGFGPAAPWAKKNVNGV
ncbi:amidase signature enzyme [Rickenella mellea]|uniref:amidase n=1 Tax=Rickenella mellea TaxID=50990 RepID=A0A4Y7Q8Q2_9AGAM|nr:amidase signature enzyme [Rickenella mellea]